MRTPSIVRRGGEELGTAPVHLLLQSAPPLPEHGGPFTQRGGPCLQVFPFGLRGAQNLSPLGVELLLLEKSGLSKLDLQSPTHPPTRARAPAGEGSAETGCPNPKHTQKNKDETKMRMHARALNIQRGESGVV